MYITNAQYDISHLWTQNVPRQLTHCLRDNLHSHEEGIREAISQVPLPWLNSFRFFLGHVSLCHSLVTGETRSIHFLSFLEVKEEHFNSDIERRHAGGHRTTRAMPPPCMGELQVSITDE
jgi:hypothetical protein